MLIINPLDLCGRLVVARSAMAPDPEKHINNFVSLLALATTDRNGYFNSSRKYAEER